MLSILIPVFNYDCSQLVKDLHAQALRLEIPFEIVAYDDGSTLYLAENQSIEALNHCRFIHFEKNTGRSAIRNKLARNACYANLLFIDCDAAVVSNDFLQNYAPYFDDDEVICGGCTYTTVCPGDDYTLRWTYGCRYEAQAAQQKNRNSFNTFSAFNFLIRKELFLSVMFDESLQNYGHEDTLLGQTLMDKGIHYHAIDNPLLHKGLDTNAVFILKTEEGVRSLFQLYKSRNYPSLEQKSKLLHTYSQLKKIYLTYPLGLIFKLLRKIFQIQLTGKSPSMQLYQFYKLACLCALK